MNILVTGGAGFIGNVITRQLLSAKSVERVWVIDKLTYAANPKHIDVHKRYTNYRFVQGDIAEKALIAEVFTELKPSIVINTAAESHVDNSIVDVRPFIETNITGTLNLLQACLVDANIKFVQVSTDEVYGPVDDDVFCDEGAPRSPQNPYAASKAAAEMLVESFVNTYGITALITRGCNTYGPNQHNEKLIPKLIGRAKANLPLPLYGDGRQVRAWLGVGDHAAAIVKLALGNYHGVFNIGSHQYLENRQVAQLVLDSMPQSQSAIQYVADRLGHDRRYALNYDKLLATGWRATEKLTQTLKAICQNQESED